MARHCSPSTDHSLTNLYRLVVLGGGAVGKTALIKRFLYDDQFIDKHRETVEDLHTKTFDVNGQLIQAHILDTAGNMSFPAMRRLSIGNANAFLLVYSITSKQSFRDMKNIFDEIKTIRGKEVRNEHRALPIVIAANKCDVVTEKWEVTRQQVDEFMLNETLDCQAAHLETSAKTGYNVRNVFETFIRLSPINKSILDRSRSDRSSRADTFFQNGHHNGPPPPPPPSNTNRLNNGGSTSPLQRKQRPPPTHRRFSLQALTLTGSSQTNLGVGGMNGEKPSRASSGESTPTLDSRKGSVPLSVGFAVRRTSNVRPFLRRHKTKSHEDLDIPECFVQ